MAEIEASKTVDIGSFVRRAERDPESHDYASAQNAVATSTIDDDDTSAFKRRERVTILVLDHTRVVCVVEAHVRLHVSRTSSERAPLLRGTARNAGLRDRGP